MNGILKAIDELGNLSCITNILENWNMGPSTYDIICPEEGITEVYVRETKDLDFSSSFIEDALVKLLDFLEKKIKQNELVFKPFDKPIRNTKSDYPIKLKLSKSTQERYERLSQGWIIRA